MIVWGCGLEWVGLFVLDFYNILCLFQPCEDNTPSFRSIQCEEFNYIPYRNGLYEWETVSIPSMLPSRILYNWYFVQKHTNKLENTLSKIIFEETNTSY